MNITKNAVVEIEYTLTGPNGQVLDTSKGREALPYMHGVGNLVPGLEAALEGKTTGDEIHVTLTPEEGYGVREPGLLQVVPRSSFGKTKRIEWGMQFRMQMGGQARMARVVGFDGNDVKIDANHPLAGLPLTFDVKVVSIREAKPEEIEHGHVHGPGGHQH